MALAALNYVSHLLVSAIEAVIEQVLSVFMVSSLIGSYVVFYINTIFKCFVLGINSLISLINIVFKDFVIFLLDVGSILAIISELIFMLLAFVFEKSIEICIALKDAVLYILKMPMMFYLAVLSSIENLLQIVVNTANLIKRAITLIGTSIWMALTFLPKMLMYLLHTMALSCLTLAFDIYEYAVDMVAQIFSGLCDKCVDMFYFFVDIPYEACGGLVLGVGLTWLIYKEQRAFKTFLTHIYRLHSKAVLGLIQIVTHSFQFLIRKVNLYCRHVYWRRAQTSGRVLPDRLLSSPENNYLPSTSSESDSSKYMLNLKRKLEAELEEKLCSVCQERRKTVIVLPCRHLCLCVECVMPVERMGNKCPLCRRHITKTMGVYV